MHRFLRSSSVALGVFAALASCTTDLPNAPSSSLLISGGDRMHASVTATLENTWVNEVHYDNAGTDINEAIEISAPAGAELNGWELVLYNGNGGAAYSTTNLTGYVAAASCGDRGSIVIGYQVDGIQNGSPDGWALKDAAGAVRFQSYEGTFAAVGGPANGVGSSDIGASQASSSPVGQSLQRTMDATGAINWVLATSTFGYCNLETPPTPPALPETRLTEIHYDNVSATDTGEGIEVEGPAGTNLNSWKLVLYNGNSTSSTTGASPYNTVTLSGSIPARCGARGVVTFLYANNTIENGDPDGFALVDESGAVVEFLSYGGVFTAKGGPAAGMLSREIGVKEGSTTSTGHSLKRGEDGVWQPASPSSFGICNSSTLPPVEPSDAKIVINELMATPHQAQGGATWGEWFEVHNYGTEAVDLAGWTISSTGQPSHIITASVIVPAGGFTVLGRGADVALNGGVTLDYNYFSGSSSTIFLDNTDMVELLDASGAFVDRVQWTSSSTMVRGVTRALRDATIENANVGGTNWGYSTTTFGDGDFGTPGAANGALSDAAPEVPNAIFFSGRLSSDVPLPVGFQDQVFASLVNGSGAPIPNQTFVWATANANVSVDQNGVVTALGAGTMVLRATAGSTTRTYSLPSVVATASATALYAGNAEFGEPADGDVSDDFIIRRDQYTSSYNRNRGTPNWVSYNIDPTHFGPQDRCDCFTFDPALPADFPRYTTADYTGAGAIAGFGIDRGHLARSFDRTSGNLDNANTFYFSNIVPQAADNNQGPWAIMENYLGDLARSQGKEVYVIAGVAGSSGTVKNEGKIVIPASVWKVAVIVPHDQGLASVNSYSDLEVIAVIMPNTPGIRNVNWEQYRTTVNVVEVAAGYDVLALLDDKIESAVEAGMQDEMSMVDKLVADGKLNAGNGNALTSKLQAAAGSIERGNNNAAVNQLEAFLHQLDALSRSRRLEPAGVSTLRSAILALIASISS